MDSNNQMPVLQVHNDLPVLMQGLVGKLQQNLAITLEAAGVYRNCLTCAKFVEHMEHCEEFGQRPPARIIAYGCDKHSNSIPF